MTKGLSSNCMYYNTGQMLATQDFLGLQNKQANRWLGVFTNAICVYLLLSPFQTSANQRFAYHPKARKTQVPSRDQRPSLTLRKKKAQVELWNWHMIERMEIQFTQCKLAHVLFLKEAWSYVWKFNVGMTVHLWTAGETE